MIIGLAGVPNETSARYASRRGVQLTSQLKGEVYEKTGDGVFEIRYVRTHQSPC